MSTLELPADVAHKVMGMLKPKARPYAVLLVTNNHPAKIKKGSVTHEEIEFLFPDHNSFGDYITCWHPCMKDLGYRALSLEFRFLNEEARTRWQKGEPYEMYRDAVYGIA